VKETVHKFILIFMLVFMVIAVALQVRFINDMDELERVIADKNAIAGELIKMCNELEKIENAKGMLKKSTNNTPVPLAELVVKTIKNVKPDDSRLVRKQIDAEWILNEQEIVFNDVSFEDIFSLLTDIQSANLPWRLKTCMLKAGNSKPGTGKAILNFVAVEYKNK